MQKIDVVKSLRCMCKNVRVKLVIFDLDDTIIENRIPFSEIRERILKNIDYKTPPKHLYEFLKEKGKEYLKMLETEEIRRAKCAKPSKDLPKILKYLDKRNIKKAILTRNSKKATFIALGEYLQSFDDVITRDDPFNPKPDPEAILYLLNKYDISNKECLVIGDYQYDMEAGKKAGCITVCIGNWDADFKIKYLGDLIKIIETLNVNH